MSCTILILVQIFRTILHSTHHTHHTPYSIRCQSKLQHTFLRSQLTIFIVLTSSTRTYSAVLFQDCVRLLNTSAGSLLLSMESLEPETLRELGVTRLTVEQARAVMSCRVELSVL